MGEAPKKPDAARRELLKLSISAAVAGMLPMEAGAQHHVADERVTERPVPTVDARFPAEIASGVFVLPDKRIPLVPNIGIIVGREAALIVDCGLGIESAENVLRLARQLAPGRRLILTVTHAHPEHGFGAQVFANDAYIYYNAVQRDYFARSGTRLLEGFRTAVLPVAHRHLLDEIVLVQPHGTYDSTQTTVDLGGRQVQLRTWGTAHSPGDEVVWLPRERILFAGDLLEERMFPIVPLFPPMIVEEDIDVANWEAVLKDMVRMKPRIIVPGHGNLAGTEILAAVLGYFQFVRDAVARFGSASRDLRSLVEAGYPTWENPDFIQPAIEYFRSNT